MATELVGVKHLFATKRSSLIRHGSHFLMVCFAFGFRHLLLTNLFPPIRSRRLRHLLYAMIGGSSNKFFKFYLVVKCSSVS